MHIGIDLGGTKTEGVVLDAHGKALQRLRYPTPQAAGYMAILQNIADLVHELEKRQGEQCSIGIGTPGSISPHTGLMRNSNTVCLNGRPFSEDLAALLKRGIRIANDANCFTLSEAIDGAARNKQVVFGVIIGTGTGGGIVVNQQVLQGAQGIAGEWGHNPLGEEKRRCYCGRVDCVETYLSGSGLLKNYENLSGKQLYDVQALLRQADKKEKYAVKALAQYYQHFGRALASVINLLDPDIIVLGGGLSNIESLYSEGAKAIKPHVFSDTFRTRVVKNRLGDSSGVLGAARLWPAR